MAEAISTTRRMTVQQFLDWLDEGPEGARYELVAGEVVSRIATRG